MSGDDPRALVARVLARVTTRIDGGRLVADAATTDPVFATATDVLAVGKAALSMLRGLPAALEPGRSVLAVAPPSLPPSLPGPVLPAVSVAVAGIDLVTADHPRPTTRSVAAAAAALAFVRAVGGRRDRIAPAGAGRGDASSRAPAQLLVLLSGGASSLLCAPAGAIAWTDKRDAIEAVARAGATIRELNVVRKHLSAIKGGQLALVTRAPIVARALSDVIGDDPATIGSGPFTADPSTFAEALAIVDRLGAPVPAVVRAHLRRGTRGERPETPKPGDAALDHVAYQVLAGPARVIAEARLAVAVEGLERPPGALPINSEDTVDALAAAILARARPTAGVDTAPRVFIGNGEPRVVLPAADEAATAHRAGRGGRATHLALAVARGLGLLPEAIRARAVFLASGTDDRDGDTDVSGAIVDGTTWHRARALGLDPEQALRRFDSLSVLAATGDTIRGPGTSNLLDLHLLVGPFR